MLACLFASGFAGLVYEIVWTRYLALFLGHTSYAVVAVLVAFMGGLAIGNAWLGRWADRVRKPLAFYGWLEVGVAAYALLFPSYYSLCHRAFVAAARTWQPDSGGLLGLKFAFGLLTVLLPTVLMGGTLPSLARFATKSLSELRQRVAMLYAVNSAGAAVGCVVADFWWIPTFGLSLTMLEAAGINLVAGVASLLLSRRLSEVATAAQDDPLAHERKGQEIPDAALRLAVIGIGVSGFAAMLYEVAWTRVLALVLGSTTHAFSLMLMTFITGLAVGAWVIARWKNLRDTLKAFAWAELVLGAAVLVSMFSYEYLPYWFAKLANQMVRQKSNYPLYELLQAAICFGVMFVPTVCLGMTLPLVSRIAAQDVRQTGQVVGRVFAVNTLGTVLGAAVTGLLLLPWLGLARTFALGIAANALVGYALLTRTGRPFRPVALGITLLMVFGFVGAAGVLFQSWPRALTRGLWRELELASTWSGDRRNAAKMVVEYYRDGAGATVTVTSWPQPEGDRYRILSINGKPDAGSTIFDMYTQLLLGHVPMLLRPQSERVLVVGLASGMTCGAVAAHPSVKRLDVVEIASEVVLATRFFDEQNHQVLNDPRLHLHVEDAKTFLLLTPEIYDVIISEPSNPWMAGVAGIFTREFYESCRARLHPDGLMVQWIHVYDCTDSMLLTALRTFTGTFPYASVWETAPGDLMLVGSARPWTVDLDALAARSHYPTVRADLELLKFTELAPLLALEVMSPETTRFVVPPDAPQHSDFDPVLEYIAQEAFFTRYLATYWLFFDERMSTRPTTLLGRYLQSHPLTAADLEAFRALERSSGLPRLDLMHSLLSRRATGDAPHHQASGDLREQRERLLRRYRAERSAFYLPPTDELHAVLEQLASADPSNRWRYLFDLAEIAWDRGDDNTCLELGFQALDAMVPGSLAPNSKPVSAATVVARMAEVLIRANKPAEAARTCERATQLGLSSPLLEMMARRTGAHANAERTGTGT